MGNISKRLPTIILGFLIGTTSFAQNLDRREHRICDLRVPVNLVVVPVTVEGKEGNLIHDLQKSDFEVREDDLVQHLTYFSTEPSPLSVAILVDRTIDDRTQEIMKHNMLALVESFSSFDEMALYEFLSTTKKLQDFTFKKEELLNPITKIEFVPCRVQVLSPLAYAPWLNTSFLDNAIMTAAYDLQRRGKNRRKVIFAVSNGVTSASERQTYRDTRKYLLQNGIVVYGIGQGNSLLFRKVDPLKKYTEPTGGMVLYPLRTSAFSETYQRVSQAARNQYILGYIPQDEFKEKTYRRITVRVTRKEVVGKVRHRRGYYAFPPP